MEKLLDFLDFDKITKLLQRYYESTGFVVGILDLEGNVLASSEWQLICNKFHRKNNSSCKRCVESDTKLASKMEEGEKYYLYECLNGLVDVVVPIEINNKHIANLYTGQFLFEEPDRDFFIKQAKQFGYNEKEYMEALEQVPVVSRDRAKQIAEFLLALTLQISDMTIQKVEMERLITSKKNAELLLLQSEDRLKTAQRIAMLGNFEHDFKKDTIWWSDEVFKILGFNKTKTPPNFETFISRMNEEDRQNVIDLVKNCQQSGEGYSTIYKYFIPGEEVKYILDTVEVVLNEKGTPTGLKGTVQDITFQIMTEKAKEESERNYQILFERAPIMLGIVDENGNYLEVNNAVFEMLGYQDNEIKGENTFEFIHKDDRDAVIEAFSKAVQNGSGEATYRFKNKNGNYRIVRSKAEKIPNTNNYLIFSDDITEKRNAEEALEKSESRYRQLVETASDAIYLMSEDGTIVDTNDEAAKMLKRSKEDIIGSLIDTVDPNFPVEDFIEFWKKTPYDEQRVFETTHITKDKEILPIEISGKKFRIDDKTFYFGVARDITNRKKADYEIKRQHDLFETIINSVPARIFWKDTNSNYLGCNNNFILDSGLTDRDEIVGKSDHDMIWKDEAESYRIDDKMVMESGIPKLKYEQPFIGPEGQEIIWRTSKLPLKNYEGSTIGIVAISEDITDEKKISEKLIQSEEKYRLIAENTTDIIWVLDIDENSFLYISPSVERTLGFEPKEIVGNGMDLVLSPNSLKYIESVVEERIRKFRNNEVAVFKDELEQNHKDGHTVWTEVHARYVQNEKTGHIEAIGISRDITDRKLAEEELLKSEELLNLTGDIAKVGGWYLDGNNNLYWTRTTKKIHEIPDDHQPTVEEAINYYHPDDRSIVAKSVETAINDGKPFNLEARLITAKGTEKWVKALGEAEMIDGNLNRLIGTFQDITEQKRIEDDLKDSQDNYKGLVEDIIDVIFELDVDGTIKFVSPHIIQMLGYKPEEITGKHFREIILPVDLDISLEGFEKHKNGGTEPVEFRMINNTGEAVWISILGKIIPNKNTFRGVMRDITKRKIAEYELKEKNEYIRKIIDDFPIGIATNEINSLKVTSINAKFAEIYGWPPEEFPTTLDFFNKVFPDKEYREELQVKIMADIESGDPNRMHWDNLRITTMSGEERLVYAFNIPLPEQNIMVSTVQDVTERRRFEDELIENVRFIKAIADTSPAMIYVYDIETNSNVYSNTGMNRLLGYTPQEILDMGETVLSDLVHPDDFHKVIDIHNNILKASDDETLFIEYRIKHKDGSWRYMHSDEKVFQRNSDGSVKQKIVIAFEITEQKQAENKLISNQQRLSAIFDNTSDYQVLVEVDPKKHFKVVAVNNSYIKRANEFGINIENDDIVGKSINELLSSFGLTFTEIKQTIDNYVKVANTKERIEFIEDILINENPYYAEISLIPILDENDNCIYILYNSHDITDRKVAEDNLLKVKEDIEESEEKYRLLHENAGLGIGYYTPDGIVVSYNSIASKNMGGVPKDFEGKSLYDLFPKEAAEEYSKRIQNTIDSNEVIVYEDSIDLPTKSFWFLSTYTKIVNSENKILGIQIISQDITSIKESENELKTAKEKAEEADKLKSAFLANMSHEIRTPMNGILGFTQLLQEPDLTGEKKDKYVEIIRKSGTRMLETLNDIIDISRIDSGQMEVSKSEVNIYEEIESEFIFFKQEALNNGLELKLFNNLPKPNRVIETDIVKFNSIISNIIKNAIKYTNEGSIEIYCEKENSFLRIKVIDTGIGIPENRIDSIFNRFEQADICDKHAREGSGLGLSISKAYVDMLGGEIGVESQEGKGSTFWFTLPWIEKQGVTNIKDNKPLDNSDVIGKYNILIVEDDDISFEHLDIVLNRISKHTFRANNGKDAVEYVKNNPETQLVLMDIKLPLMSGTDATKEIRKFNKDIIIIAQTAYGLTGDSEMAFEAGCNDYISKPINKERLFELIEKHLG